jgi:hypothetical protein
MMTLTFHPGKSSDVLLDDLYTHLAEDMSTPVVFSRTRPTLEM